MPVPAHVRVEYRGVFGTLAAPMEEWSFSLRHADLPDLNEPSEMIGLADSARSQFSVALGGLLPGNSPMSTVKVSRIEAGTAAAPGGRVRRTADGRLLQGVNVTGVNGTSGATNAAPQLAICVSLTTARAGATGKGRFFLPMMAVTPSLTDRRLTAADAGAIATAARNLIVGLNGALGFGSISVVSSTGAISPVTGVRVGRAIDTIRSRRGKMLEEYANLAI